MSERPRLLLDTAAVIAIAGGQLPVAARKAYLDAKATIYISVVSLWEIGIKTSLGKLPIPKPFVDFVRDWETMERVVFLPLTGGPIQRLPDLPDVHRDPFDRLLVCQAMELSAAILSPDTAFDGYGIERIW